MLRLRQTQRIGSLEDIGPAGARLGKARQYVTF
jgi:hypothetical protein